VSTIVRRKRTSRCELSQYRRHELLTGDLVYPLLQYYTGQGRDQIVRRKALAVAEAKVRYWRGLLAELDGEQ
jgi:hypothetical protein